MQSCGECASHPRCLCLPIRPTALRRCVKSDFVGDRSTGRGARSPNRCRAKRRASSVARDRALHGSRANGRPDTLCAALMESAGASRNQATRCPHSRCDSSPLRFMRWRVSEAPRGLRCRSAARSGSPRLGEEKKTSAACASDRRESLSATARVAIAVDRLVVQRELSGSHDELLPFGSQLSLHSTRDLCLRVRPHERRARPRSGMRRRGRFRWPLARRKSDARRIGRGRERVSASCMHGGDRR